MTISKDAADAARASAARARLGELWKRPPLSFRLVRLAARDSPSELAADALSLAAAAAAAAAAAVPAKASAWRVPTPKTPASCGSTSSLVSRTSKTSRLPEIRNRGSVTTYGNVRLLMHDDKPLHKVC